MGVFDGGVNMFYTRPSDQKTYCFSPVPLLAESKEFLKTGAGEVLSITHTLNFTGTLLPSNPALSGVPDLSTCISLLSRKRKQMCEALSEDYGDLLVVDASGYPIISTKPRVLSLDFDEGVLVQQSPYSLSFEYDEILATGTPVRGYDESWEFGQNENDTLTVTHNISAEGIRDTTLGIEPHLVAKDFVLSRLGYDASNSFAMRTPYVASLLDISTLTAYNKVFSESVDITAGSYSVTETWTAASGNFLDDRSISNSFARDEEGVFFETQTINGTVQGYGDTTFERLQNAEDGFDTFVAPQIGFNDSVGVESKEKNSNRIAGTVGYSIVRVPDSGGQPDLIGKTISRSIERNEDGSVTQSVTTTAAVRQSSASGIQLAIDYCFANNFPLDSTEPIFDASLSGNLVSVSTQRSELEKSFSLTRVYTDQTTANYTESYEIEVSQALDTSQVSISIQGVIQGLGAESTTKSIDRFLSASGAYFSVVEPLISTRVANVVPADSCVSSDPLTKTIGYNELVGTISYSQNFETRIKSANPNILKEEIDINFELPAQVIAVIPIPGKASGPILQDQETVTGKKKTLSIQYSMLRADSTCANSVVPSNVALQNAIDESDILVNNTPSSNDRGEKPSSSKVFKTQDTIAFNRQTYAFTRNVTWQYL
jgi:hypothetical protein